jgi:rfaE bifunctional protein nucleotidyltransferase chain/domain
LIIKSLPELRKLAEEHKINNFKLGTINGTFDLLHSGHIDAFNFATNNCDKLFILINSDESVRLYKGPSRPKDKEAERAKKIQNAYPDAFIYIFDELNPLSVLEEIMPNVHFIGSDWGNKSLEQELVERSGGEIKFIVKKKEISTTTILEEKGANELSNRAIFLDRDGTIIIDKEYLKNIDDIEFFPQAINSLLKLSNLGYFLFIVSNQSMVGRKMSTKENALKINKEIVKQLKDKGVEIKESFLDFSHPNDPSNTRKPNIEFLKVAASKYDLALKDCWVIGDKSSDIIFGKRGNTKTIQINGSYRISNFADFIANNLGEAYKIIDN